MQVKLAELVPFLVEAKRRTYAARATGGGALRSRWAPTASTIATSSGGIATISTLA